MIEFVKRGMDKKEIQIDSFMEIYILNRMKAQKTHPRHPWLESRPWSSQLALPSCLFMVRLFVLEMQILALSVAKGLIVSKC